MKLALFTIVISIVGHIHSVPQRSAPWEVTACDRDGGTRRASYGDDGSINAYCRNGRTHMFSPKERDRVRNIWENSREL